MRVRIRHAPEEIKTQTGHASNEVNAPVVDEG